jgi:hypothetical protein
MKAAKAGRIIGTALENYDAASPRVSVLTQAEEADRAVVHKTDLPSYHSDPSKWAPGVGKIMVITNVSLYDPTNQIQASASGIDALQARVTAMEQAQGGQITGSLNVSGTATVGSLTVTGLAIISSLSVTGNVTVGGNLAVAGSVTTGAILPPSGPRPQSPPPRPPVSTPRRALPVPTPPA